MIGSEVDLSHSRYWLPWMKGAPAGTPWDEQSVWFAKAERRDAYKRYLEAKPLPFNLRKIAHEIYERTRAEKHPNVALKAFRSYVRGITDRAAEARHAHEAARITARDALPLECSDEHVKQWARKRVADCLAAVMRAGSEADTETVALFLALHHCAIVAAEYAISEPLAKTRSGVVRRYCCSRWWRRAARVYLKRAIEKRAIGAGHVSRIKGIYLSNFNFERGKAARERNRQLLDETAAVNELGQWFTLSELAGKSTSKPHLRFSEMIVRIKGLEAIAERDGWRGLFLTLTCPSRFHARHSETCEENGKWDKSLPREAQAYLVSLWAKVRATFKRVGVDFFGLRVAEPHHDGCPHWHLMLWVKPEHQAEALDVMERYALRDSPDEPGARQHRFKVEVIEKSKGGAASYLAKYVSKMTTGAGVGNASERGTDGVRRDTGKATTAALRAQLWAWVHGIRQFQFFGTPAVGIWREFRRMRDEVTADSILPVESAQMDLFGSAAECAARMFEAARKPADKPVDYAAHVDAVGGVCVKRADRPFTVGKAEQEGPNSYGEEKQKRVTGILMPGVAEVITRMHRWIIAPLSGVAPWTRVNNCNDQSGAARMVRPDWPGFSNWPGDSPATVH